MGREEGGEKDVINNEVGINMAVNELCYNLRLYMIVELRAVSTSDGLTRK